MLSFVGTVNKLVCWKLEVSVDYFATSFLVLQNECQNERKSWQPRLKAEMEYKKK